MFDHKINVARRIHSIGSRHFFHVDLPGSACSEFRAGLIFAELKERFPEPEFKVTVVRAKMQEWERLED